MEILIGAKIRQLRKARDMSQEQLAEAVGVTVQAVSKWETQQSLPDIGIVPDIAEFFGVSLERLFFGNDDGFAKTDVSNVPRSGKLYIVQVRDGKVLGADEWERDKRIHIDLGENGGQLSAEIWGNADIKGNIGGGVSVNGCANCGNIGGGVVANGGINCGNISGGAVADGVINCGNVSGGVNAGTEVHCGNIAGAVSSQGNISCGDISEGCEIKCRNLYCKGKIASGKIEGEIHTEDVDF